jgi:hypothetical protein
MIAVFFCAGRALCRSRWIARSNAGHLDAFADLAIRSGQGNRSEQEHGYLLAGRGETQ